MSRPSHAAGAKSSHRLGAFALTSSCVTVILACAAPSAHAGVTFVTAEVDTIATSAIREGNRGQTQKASDFGLAPQDLSADSNPIVHNGPADHASLHVTASAAFTDATAGTITMVSAGDMNTLTRPDSPFVLNEASMTYAYDFTIDQDEPFIFDYAVLGGATPLGAPDFVFFQPYEFRLTNAASGLVATGSFVSGDAGSIAIPLGFDPSVAQSGAYRLDISGFNKAFLRSQTSATYNSTGDFDFRIGASNVAANVPEPSSWILMIVGFGAAGSMARRRPRPARG